MRTAFLTNIFERQSCCIAAAIGVFVLLLIVGGVASGALVDTYRAPSHLSLGAYSLTLMALPFMLALGWFRALLIFSMIALVLGVLTVRANADPTSSIARYFFLPSERRAIAESRAKEAEVREALKGTVLENAFNFSCVGGAGQRPRVVPSVGEGEKLVRLRVVCSDRPLPPKEYQGVAPRAAIAALERGYRLKVERENLEW